MKKANFLCLSFILISLYGNVYSQKNRAIKNGFGLNFMAGLPSPDNYGITGLDPDLNNFVMFGFEIGNRWYIKPQPKFGFGITVNWFDGSFAKANVSPPKEFSNNNVVVYSLSLLELGPIGTYAINPNTGLDLYYHIRPTYLKTAVYLDKQYDAGEPFGFGISHDVGVKFRWKTLAIGAEYVFGKIKPLEAVLEDAVQNTAGGTVTSDTPDKINTSHVRILLGFKF